MADGSAIEWTDATWNPVRGCTKVSPGCKHHHSGQLRHPDGGPYVFIAERPPEQPLQVVLGLRVDAAEKFKPPASGTVKRRFTKQHWGSLRRGR